MLQQRWAEAATQINTALAEARAVGARPFEVALELLRVQCQVKLNLPPDTLFLKVGDESKGIIERGHLWATLAAVLSGSEPSPRVMSLRGRARRVFESSGWPLPPQLDLAEVPATPPAQDLDTAVALIELGGHPHILGREAMAVLAGADCATALALVVRGAAAPRIIETHGCDDRRAMAMARKPDGLDLIALGEHRDEPWQILAEPRPELEHRCTLIAIRKLIDAAVTLDRYRREEKERAALWPTEALDGDPDAVWASEPMSEVLHIARRIAPSGLSILITGETGSGKEVLARTIHRASGRAAQPFLPFNCTAVPRDMLESQLFGHRKGAFTGADAAFPGVIRSAAGGTLFLDEIAEVPLDLQPKLLRFLEAHEIHPLGEPQPLTVDVRVIAATNAPLEQLVAEGRLREDLFYRLNVIRLHLPPLRERREEIPPLVEHYLRRFGDEQKKGRLTVSDEALEYLLLYSWPGNLRQLANEMRRVAAMAEPDAVITPALLSGEIQASRRTIPADAPLPAAPDAAEVRLRIDQPLPAAVEYLEQVMVRNALARAQGRVEEAARLLGISRKGLFLKRRRWGISAFD
jgi:DNA-binding NtrC family response regulator